MSDFRAIDWSVGLNLVYYLVTQRLHILYGQISRSFFYFDSSHYWYKIYPYGTQFSLLSSDSLAGSSTYNILYCYVGTIPYVHCTHDVSRYYRWYNYLHEIGIHHHHTISQPVLRSPPTIPHHINKLGPNSIPRLWGHCKLRGGFQILLWSVIFFFVCERAWMVKRWYNYPPLTTTFEEEI